MRNNAKAICLLLGLCVLSALAAAQETESAWANSSQAIPEILRRPEQGEAPRYPKDMVIGELGKGESPGGAYKFALDLLSVLVSGSKDAQIVKDGSSVLTDTLLENINSIKPRSYRIGGGRVEADGSVSYLVRFLGADESITGELFLRPAAPPPADQADSASPEAAVSGENMVSPDKPEPGEVKWVLDDLVIEEKRELGEIRDSYRYDFSPYERFY